MCGKSNFFIMCAVDRGMFILLPAGEQVIDGDSIVCDVILKCFLRLK